MPRATVRADDIQHFELKSAPPDGWIDLRRLSYGQILTRREAASRLTMELAGRGRGQSDMRAEMQAIKKTTQLWELAHCVVDHNLTDESERKLNLSNAADVEMLDPRVGQEIDQYISDMNNYEGSDNEGNSSPGSEL